MHTQKIDIYYYRKNNFQNINEWKCEKGNNHFSYTTLMKIYIFK